MNFEANRRKLLEDLKRQKDKKKIVPEKPLSAYSQDGSAKRGEKTRIVLFAQKSLFLSNLLASLGQSYDIKVYYDVDKATDYIIEHNIKFVIIDIDPPSDYHNAANFLTVVKSVSGSIMIFICARNKDESRTRLLIQHGGIICEKPVSIPELTAYFEGYKKN